MFIRLATGLLCGSAKVLSDKIISSRSLHITPRTTTMDCATNSRFTRLTLWFSWPLLKVWRFDILFSRSFAPGCIMVATNTSLWPSRSLLKVFSDDIIFSRSLSFTPGSIMAATNTLWLSRSLLEVLSNGIIFSWSFAPGSIMAATNSLWLCWPLLEVLSVDISFSRSRDDWCSGRNHSDEKEHWNDGLHLDNVVDRIVVRSRNILPFISIKFPRPSTKLNLILRLSHFFN